MADEVLTIAEAAELLRVHPQTVYRQVRAGKLPALKVGDSWRISRVVIMRLLEGDKKAVNDDTITDKDTHGNLAAAAEHERRN